MGDVGGNTKVFLAATLSTTWRKRDYSRKGDTERSQDD